MKQFSFLIVLCCLAGCFSASPEKTGLEGTPLPAFNILLPDSVTWFNTSRIPSGKPIALFYFSPHCPYCQAFTKEIIEEINELKDIQFYFVTAFPLQAVKAYYNEYHLAKYPNITIGQDTALFVHKYFEVGGVPYTAIYGKDKKLNKAFMGRIYTRQLKKVAEE